MLFAKWCWEKVFQNLNRKKNKELTIARDRSKELSASLSTAKERTALAQKTIENQDVKLAKLQREASISSKELTQEQKEIKRLIKQSEHKNSDVRISATEALGQIGARKTVKKCQLRH